jgi:hypothetical protein
VQAPQREPNIAFEPALICLAVIPTAAAFVI